MTPHPPSPDSHPDPELLADLAEELLPADQADPLHAHLATCPECADTYTALAEISALLGESEQPAMPEDVTARLDAAIAAEAAGRATVTPAPDRPAPIAPPKGHPSGSTRPPTGGPAHPRRRRTGRILLGTAALAGLLTLGSVLLFQSTEHATTAGTAASRPTAPAVAPGGSPASRLPATAQLPEYREDTLAAQVRDLLATLPSPGLAPENSSNGGPAADQPPACVTAATGHPGETPLAARPGRYGTSTVTALVYRAKATGRVEVYLVTPDCPGATVLLHSTVPTP